jgi:parvulin-like peptidyl-prolyl isomerase
MVLRQIGSDDATKQWKRESARGGIRTSAARTIHMSTTQSTYSHTIMAPKGKGGDKGKTAEKGADRKGGAQKGAQSINVRHILCEKHAKKEEALKKLNDGVAFNKVAEEYSEDKARAGEISQKIRVLHLI